MASQTLIFEEMYKKLPLKGPEYHLYFEELYKKHFNHGQRGYPYFGNLLPSTKSGPLSTCIKAEEVERLSQTDQAHLNTILNRLKHIRNSLRKARKEMENLL